MTIEEEKNLQCLLEKDSYRQSRLDAGQKLVELSSGALRLSPKKGYIAVQPPGAERSLRRKAISLLSEGIRFTVSDWMLEAEARNLGLITARETKAAKEIQGKSA